MKNLVTILCILCIPSTYLTCQLIDQQNLNKNGSFWDGQRKSESEFWNSFLPEDQGIKFETRDSFFDVNGNLHKRMEQHYRGTLIEHASLLLHYDSAERVRANGSVANGRLVDLPPHSVSLESSIQIAANYFENRYHSAFLVQPPELLITRLDLEGGFLHGNLTYAWRVFIRTDNPVESKYLYIHGTSGEIIREKPNVLYCDNGKSYPIYYDWQYIGIQWFGGFRNKYYLYDQCRGNFIHTKRNKSQSSYLLHANCSNVWSGNSEFEAGGTERFASTLHWSGEMTYDYFLNQHYRNSFDGSGGGIKLVYVSNTLVNSGGLPIGNRNAFWVLADQEAHFGRGNGSNPMVALDVVGHELTHGIIQETSNLTGSAEASALNESFCDIFGTNVEHYVAEVKNLTRHKDYKIGELCTQGALRSLENPPLYGGSNVYQGQNWDTSNTISAWYTNAGVQNYCFFLLANGSNGRTTQNGARVCALGRRKAAIIAYHAMVAYSWPNMDFPDSRMAFIWAAEDIYLNSTFEAEQCRNAWAAVGVGQPGSPCNFVGWQEESQYPQFSIYPNPASHKLCLAGDTSYSQ